MVTGFLVALHTFAKIQGIKETSTVPEQELRSSCVISWVVTALRKMTMLRMVTVLEMVTVVGLVTVQGLVTGDSPEDCGI